MASLLKSSGRDAVGVLRALETTLSVHKPLKDEVHAFLVLQCLLPA